MSKPTSISALLAGAATQLQAVSPTARLDAEVLLSQASGLSRSQLTARPGERLSKKQGDRFQGLLGRRLRGEPVAYITGWREFWSLELAVCDATLIPRPETELLVERALARIPKSTGGRIADLGTGSGAVALALAKERPRCRIIATEICANAIAVAQGNAARHQLKNIQFRHGDWFAPLQGESFDCIVANPPYVGDDDPHLSQGDLRFEPSGALRGGGDGLSAIRHILEQAGNHLAAGGWLLLEHGFDQASRLAQLMVENGYKDIACYRDPAGIQRVSECRRPWPGLG